MINSLILFVFIETCFNGFHVINRYNFRQNDCKAPVLKHGPRSLACMQVLEYCKTLLRNESKTGET